MIVDCHAHFEPRMLESERMVSKLDEEGIDRVALIAPMNDPLPHTPDGLLDVFRFLMQGGMRRHVAEAIHRLTLTKEGNLRLGGDVFQLYARPDNKPVFDLVEKNTERFLAWAFLNPKSNPNVVDQLEQLRSRQGLIGIKLHPHWHDYKTDLLDPLLRRAEELRLPTLIHLGFGERGNIEAMATRFPKLKIISAHAGFPFYSDLWKIAKSYPNIYVDLSSPYINEELARAAVIAMGPERCLYGTDAPYGFPGEDDSFDYGEIKRWIERMPVSSSKREQMFADNFMNLIQHHL